MKLFYFKRDDDIENFGDSLNPWLWNKFIASELDEDETTAFVGIGTILNGLLPYRLERAKQFVVFSSGLGYGRGTIPAIDSHWKIYCVRGPLSARQIGAPEALAVADGALLLRRVYQPKATKEFSFGFMPHIQQVIAHGPLWQAVCAEAGIRYIDPSLPLETVLGLVDRTEILIADAMHGAIAAEALRVPWIPVRTNPEIFTFKWVDWCSSLGLPYHPQDIPLLSSTYAEPQARKAAQRHQHRCWQQAPVATLLNSWKPRKTQVAQRLRQIATTAQPMLSPDQTIESLTSQLEERLDLFKQDVRTGKFVQSQGAS